MLTDDEVGVQAPIGRLCYRNWLLVKKAAERANADRKFLESHRASGICLRMIYWRIFFIYRVAKIVKLFHASKLLCLLRGKKRNSALDGSADCVIEVRDK
jgi:hypothetical protein